MAAPEVLEQDIVKLRREIQAKDELATEKRGAADQLVEDIRASGVDPLTDSEAFGKVDDAYKEANLAAEEAAELRRRLDVAMQMATGRRGEPSPQDTWRADQAASVADRFLASPVYQHLKASGRLDNPTAAIGHTDPVAVATREEFRTFLAATAGVGPLVPEDQRLGQIAGIPVRIIRLFDLVTVGDTDSDTVEWVEETVRTDAAAETAPGTAAPEATYTYERRQTTVRDITHFTPATKNNLADAGQARTLLESRLMNGVQRRTESQMVNGNGVGDNLEGIRNRAGIGTIARNTAGGERRLEACHRGITSVRLNLEMEPTGIGVHPTTYEQTVFEKDNNGQYLMAPDISASAAKTIWGLPAVISTAFTAGEFAVGHWREGAILWLRSGVSVSASDQHADFFIKRLVAMLALLRAAFKVTQPKAFTVVTGN